MTNTLTNATPIAEHRAAAIAARQALHTMDDWLATVQRARQATDPTGTVPTYEGLRQREGALQRTSREIHERLNYLLLALDHVAADLERLGTAE